MTLLHTMSLTGGAAVVMYLLMYMFTKRHLSLLWHKVYLTITIFLFCIPLACLKTDYVRWVSSVLGLKAWYQKNNVVKNLSSFSIQVYEDGFHVHNWWLYVVLLLGLTASMIILTGFIARYLKVIRSVLEVSNETGHVKRAFYKISQKANLHVKTQVYVSSGIDTPVVVGLIHQKIVLPNVSLSEECIEDVLYHELIHVKCMDNLVKLLLLAVVILNFYNPTVYYLWYRWNLVSEMYCDSKVIAGKGTSRRKAYANLIIDFAEEKNAAFLPIVGLSTGHNIEQRQLKERIRGMKKAGRQYGKISKIAGGITILASVFVSSLTAYAYEPRQIRYYDERAENRDVEEWFAEGSDVVLYEQDLVWKEYEQYISASADIFFVDVSGNVSYDIHTDESMSRISCNHTYSDGTFVRHSKYSDGSCKVDYYDGKKCTKCGYVTYGDHISTISYTVCPH